MENHGKIIEQSWKKHGTSRKTSTSGGALIAIGTDLLILLRAVISGFCWLSSFCLNMFELLFVRAIADLFVG